MSRRRSPVATILATALIAGLSLVAGTVPGPVPAQAVAQTAALVGSLQSELGCPEDWQPECAATELAKDPSGDTFRRTFTIPAGSWEYKVALNDAWDESYGPEGDGANGPLVLQAPAEVEVVYDDTSNKTTITPTGLDNTVTAADRALATDSLRNDLSRERFYFVMADRFANGSTANDEGGLTGTRLVTGFDPEDKGFYHGGDLKGLTDKLDYIKGMGTTAIWLTPSFKNRPVQGSGNDVSAGYHGYWITDFTQIDPHLGTNDDMKRLIDSAHAKGMKVFFDIITNHTADVIDYDPASYSYIDKATSPYRDASGNVFDDKDYAGTNQFPSMNPDDTSFPRTPVFRTEADKTVKVPAWLNDPTLYHNRGDSTFSGENVEYGDFSGLDDLFTENYKVVDGMTDVYKTWVDLGIDGFRIDTVKHVNMEFWQKFSPALLQRARDIGNDDFFMFGEVFDANPAFMSTYTTAGKLQATLDFGFQSAAQQFAGGKNASVLRDLFAGDDYYTDTDSNAYSLPTFLGNHDMGRLPALLGAGFDRQAKLERVRLANQLMFLTRGQPVTYYGDEQGFIGAGGDKDARQDMFATKTQQYADEENLFGTGGSMDRYDTDTPLYRLLKELSALRQAHPALADGAQVSRYADAGPGVYAFSRINPRDAREYIVAVNNSTDAKSADFDTYGDTMRYRPVYGASKSLVSRADGRVKVTVPGLSVSVWKADRRAGSSAQAPVLYPRAPGSGADFAGRAKISAALGQDEFAQVTFAWRPAGTQEWTKLGTDDNAPYAVYHDTAGLAKGSLVEYRIIAKDLRGRYGVTTTSGIVGAKGTDQAGPGEGGGPVVQPANASIPGSHNSEMGCPGDWAPDCDQAQLTRDPGDDIWKKTVTVPAGSYAYKIAVNKSWDENYGVGGVLKGNDIPYTAPGGPVSFYYDHRTKNIQNTAQGDLVVAAGSFQSELGCAADWDPACMRAWLGDPDGDKIWTWTGTGLPKGDYEFKIALNLNWNVNYGEGGAPGGANIKFSVPSDGLTVQFRYDATSRVPTTAVSQPASSTDLTKAKAYWVKPGLLAWPADAVPPADQPGMMRWRLHASADGGMTFDSERIASDQTYNLRFDPAGLPAAVVAKYPYLQGYLALKFDGSKRQAKRLLKGQLAVGQYSDGYKLRDGTGVQIATVVDALYAKAAQNSYGIDWRGSRATFRIWAPTARSAALLLWPAGSAADAPTSQATRLVLDAARDGSWSGRPRRNVAGARYLYELEVYQPATGKVETNLVTDPYSVALTVDSTRSVAVDLADRRYQPALWRKTPSPKLARGVDSTIYELQVRDFSVNDQSVPADNRGSYLAFADRNGNGWKHLRSLAQAGLNTVHLLPTFDIASIPEDPAKQKTPQCDLPSLPPDSEEQQACVTAVAADDAFNWGYDPWHWMAPEGSYASSAQTADGGQRVAEFRTMVGGLHAAGLRVVLDQVYNHTPTSGQAPTSVLDKVVPGYYQRLDENGAVTTSTCCQNVATENTMAEKIMVDSTVLWAKQYRVDGFRFDLMGHHSKANMLAVRAALDKLTMRKDGVDGKKIYLYGEGWNFGEVADNARFYQATQGQLGGTGIGTFSDRLRDAVRGGGPFDDDPRRQGLGTGLVTDPNGVDPDGAGPGGDAALKARLANYTDLTQLGLAGNLRAYSFRNYAGEVVRGDQVRYGSSPAGYADQPDEVITYVDAHDNETLFDELTYKLPRDTPMADRVRMNTVALSFTALSQTPSFWHAGADLLRSKSLDRNSYNSGDWFNILDWTGADNGFGRGLPPRADNESKWQYQRPLLADPALKPSSGEVQTATAAAQDLLRLRFSTPLFRLGSADAINQKVTFPVSGTSEARDGVIVMRIDDTRGPGVDPRLRGAVVVFNASPDQVVQRIPGLSGTWVLSPVQAAGSDPVVKTSSWNAAAGSFTVPGRTVAVFVQPG